MAGWRALKQVMLVGVHQHFEIPAVYLTHATGTPVAVTVRLHRKQVMERPPLGTSDEIAGMQILHDRIVFKKSQLPNVPEGIMSNSYVVFGPNEAYFTGPSKPSREGYIYCEVVDVTQSDLDAFLATVDLSHPAWATVGL